MKNYSVKLPDILREYAPNFSFSLRNANLSPSVDITAGVIRGFFREINEKPPEIIFFVNQDFLRLILQKLPPIEFLSWGITLNADDFDIKLDFLIRSYISGKLEALKPMKLFFDTLFSDDNMEVLTQNLITMPWRNIFAEKHIVFSSLNKSLQSFFAKMEIKDVIQIQPNAHNLYFDFLSIAGNLSERFVWTKIFHTTTEHDDNNVYTIKIKRNFLLPQGEIEKTLNIQSISENVKDLLTPDLRWKLGEGLNKMIMRVFVPEGAVLLWQKNKSGIIIAKPSVLKGFSMFEVPVFLDKNETIETSFAYKISNEIPPNEKLSFYLHGTPGANNRTFFIPTIQTDRKIREVSKGFGNENFLYDSIFSVFFKGI